MKRILKIGLVALSALFVPIFVFAAVNQTETECLALIDKGCTSLDSSICRQSLEKCASFYEEESNRIEADMTKTAKEKKTLQGKITDLNNKIKNLEYQINRSNLIIKDLTVKIGDTQDSIVNITNKIGDSKLKLSVILRTMYEEDQKSIAEILLSEEKISDFFNNIIDLEILNSKSKDILKDIKALKESLEQQKVALGEEKTGLEDTVQIQTMQKTESTKTKKEQESTLKLTEAQYQKMQKDKEEAEKKASEIRAKIYQLIGVRKAVTYEEALTIAKYSALQAGIRPALLLGVLSQESSIGRNVGQCYVKNSSTGAGIIASTGKTVSNVMKPSRDIPIFLDVIDGLNKEKNLGLKAFETLVSCPMSFGYGGAMGPAQFIPSTWILFDDKVQAKTGTFPDPWDLRDASLASAIYLADGIQRYGTEGKAVQAYFCGSANNTYWCKWYQNNVLALADCHQQFIDNGSMSASCQDSIGLK
jgi:peptidoglycan hydrolase CwlO-like protein